MRPIFALAATVAALTLTACGSSSSSTTGGSASPGGTTTQATSSAATTTVTTTAPSTATNSASARTGPATTRACVASMLTASYLGGLGATGHGELGFALRNTSRGSCHTYGYPGVLFLGRRGQALPTSSTRTSRDFFGTAPEVKLLLAPGQIVSFRLGVTHGAATSAGCTTAYGLQVIAPDDTATMHAKIRSGAYECGTATVSPLRPGTSAFR